MTEPVPRGAGGHVTSGRSLERAVQLDCDLVVVGTGAGGGMLMRDAARAGLQVIALEEGEHRTSSSFGRSERDMLSLLYQDGAGRATRDGAIAVLQGRGVGGSTVHNTNLCKRAPGPVLEHWTHELKLAGWSAADLDEDYRAVEELLGVAPIEPERVNRNNALLLQGMRALGWRGGLLMHNRKGCAGSGLCELGCPFDGKQNTLKVLVPDAVAHGAALWSDVRVERVIIDHGRAVGVRGRVVGGARAGLGVTVRARAVALAGSAVGSAALALASGLDEGPAASGLVGRNLHLHPGVAIAGIFDERVEGWSGIPQSVECTEHIDYVPGSPRRIWIVPAFAHPIGFAASLPGFGAEHRRALRRYPHTAILVAMLHDESSGRVTVDGQGRPRIDYRLDEGDRVALAQGMAACARLLLAAGAREVVAPCERPIRVRTEAEAAALSGHRYRPLDPALTAVHPMGTLPMSVDGRRGVTDAAGRWHGVAGLYVADGSLFPTSLGGPPQLTIYAAGRRVARTIAADLR